MLKVNNLKFRSFILNYISWDKLKALNCDFDTRALITRNIQLLTQSRYFELLSRCFESRNVEIKSCYFDIQI